MNVTEKLPTRRSAWRPHVDAVRSPIPGGATPPADHPDALLLYCEARRQRARAVGNLLVNVARALSPAAMCSKLLGRSARRGLAPPATGDTGWHDSSRTRRLRWQA
jgi:hypothetical protein